MANKFEQEWGKDKEQVEKEEIDLAVQSLQSGAESYLVDARRSKLAAEKAVKEAVMKAQKNPDFGRIVESHLALKERELELGEARKVYEEYFGEEPKIST